MICVAGPNLPHEVLRAAGRHGGALQIDPARETPKAQQWVESKFMPFAFPLVEAWADGEYDALDMVLFSRADDTSQRLYYYLTELQRRGLIDGPEAAIMDVARIPRSASLAHMTKCLRAFASRLGVAEEDLEEAIVQTNLERADKAAQAQTEPVCLFWGSSTPDSALHDAIRTLGFDPVGQTLADEWMDLGEPVAERSGDPILALAQQMHDRSEGARSFADPAQNLRQMINDSKARAVVLWRIEEDEARCWHLPQECKVFDDLGIPSLIMTRRDWLGRDGAVEEISSFLAEISK